MKSLSRIILLIFLLVSCKVEPQPIEFGHDACHFCTMGIADPIFAAEIVTVKGKVYKYDSIECLIRSLKEMNTENKFILVMDYTNPGTFINAEDATFLISYDTRSPMGANLSAFPDKESIDRYELEGTLFNWESINTHID